MKTEEFTIEENVLVEGDIRIVSSDAYEYRIAIVTGKEGEKRIFLTDNFSILPVVLTHPLPEDYELNFDIVEHALMEIYDSNINKTDAAEVKQIESILDFESMKKVRKLLLFD